MKIFHAAPNFSEGRDADTLAALRSAGAAQDAVLADFSADPDHNRCVATLVGGAEDLTEALLAMARVAVECIDLSRHQGQHPFIGVLDVAPFIPLRDATMADADAVAHTVGARLTRELGVPVYYYAFSASSPERASLPALRKGGLAGLEERMTVLPPDEGPARPHPTAGVSVVGAREALIAYNVNLRSNDLAIARRIARRIREANGGMPGIRALGMRLASKGCVQVSVNITDVRAVTMADVYEAVRSLAANEGVETAGAELIGGIARENLERNAGRDFGCAVRSNQILG